MLINFFHFAKILKMVPTVFANSYWVVNGQSLYSLQLSALHIIFQQYNEKLFNVVSFKVEKILFPSPFIYSCCPTN